MSAPYTHHMAVAFRTITWALTLTLCITAAAAEEPLVELGRALFFDRNLSEPRGQACATCHDPDRAFSDPRRTGANGALSAGADGRSLGDRNTPGLTYVATVPPFGRVEGHYHGGLFLDGRAQTLVTQAAEPLLNPLEMGLPDEAAVVSRVLANPDHARNLKEIFGDTVSAGKTAEAIFLAIAAFERSIELSAFDSKYDRFLTGDYAMTREEAIGRELFFSDLVNCVQCHLNEPGKVSERETFTNHRYHNIGVPVNTAARQANGLGASHVDPGLADHPQVRDAREAGKFRVPGLRNVAVTAPYMHNGVFETLETAVAFYGKYILDGQVNPETGDSWMAPEVSGTVDRDLLESGQPIDRLRARHLAAFLKTLTDRRYEHLIE